ncbi:MAG: response regulator [Alphaproteobacteria bacterium]
MAYDLGQIQLLLIEDNPNMRSLVKAMLVALGVKYVRDFSNGQQAVNAVEEFTPDLIITDWMTALVDGLQFAKFIRNDDDSPDIFTPIVLMSGHTEQWRVNMARDAGVNEFLAKPISVKTLYDRILAVIEKPRPFVRTKNYFGPCRRRVNSQDYAGPERRFSGGKVAPPPENGAQNEAELENLLENL